MLRQISPRLGRFDIVSNSFGSCISNASEEFAWTPKMSFSKVISQPRMLMQKFESTVTFEQLQSFADTHSCRHLNKDVDMVNSNMQLINVESVFVSNLPDKKLTIHPDSIEFHGVSGIFALPDKVEGILPEGVFSRFQIHFFAPKLTRNIIAHANFLFNSGAQQSLSYVNRNQKLNFTGGRIPPMLESTGILRQM